MTQLLGVESLLVLLLSVSAGVHGLSDSCSSATHVLFVNQTEILNEVLKSAAILSGSVCVHLDAGTFIIATDTERELPSGHISYALNLTYADVIIEGVGIGLTRVICEGGAGLGFTGEDITLRGFSMVSCAALQESTSKNTTDSTYSFYTALYFRNVHSLSVEHLEVSYSSGTGMTLYNVNGHVSIQFSSFTSNQRLNPKRNNSEAFPGGGGVYIEFSYCNPGVVDEKCSQPLQYNSDSWYNISHCKFSNNVASATIVREHRAGNISDTFHAPYGIYHQAFGRGGGLSIFFKGSATRNAFFIEDCIFINNIAIWGGGFFAEFQDNVTLNTVRMSQTILVANNCTNIPGYENSGTAGGGMRLGFIAVDYSRVSNNSLEFDSCTVEQSTALIGGGTAFYSSIEFGLTKPTNRISFTNCSWVGNVGLIGAAVNLHAWLPSSEGALPVVKMRDCLFVNNTAAFYETRHNQGTGALYVDSLPVKFDGFVNFTSNLGGGLAATATGVDVMTNASLNFVSNSAIHGGGVQLLGYAYLRMWPHALAYFKDNTASLFGGAIFAQYVGNNVAVYYFNCFIRPHDYYTVMEDWAFDFVFDGNCARMHGNDIYATTLVPCLWPYVSTDTKFSLSSLGLLFRNFTYRGGANCYTCNTSIATEAANFTASTTGKYYSGQSVHVPIQTKDELNNSVHSVLLASVKGHQGANVTWLTSTDGTIVLSKNYTGDPTDNEATTVSFQSVRERLFKFDVSYQLQPCPDGRFYHNKSEHCLCGDVPYGSNHSPYVGLIACGRGSLVITPGYWIGHLSDNKTFAIGRCAFGLCQYNFSTEGGFLVKVSAEGRANITGICAEGRTGILCGQCLPDFAPQVGSMATLYCVPCQLSKGGLGYLEGALIYILVDILPLVVFCLCLVYFGVKITQGPLHSFVFFSQVLPTLLQFNLDISVLQWPPIGMLYNVWQFNVLGIIKRYVCFFPGANSLEVISFGIVKPIVATLLVGLLVVFVRNEDCHCRCCNGAWAKIRRFLRNRRQKIKQLGWHLANGMISVAIICFCKVIEISMNLLTLQCVYTSKNSQPTTRWVVNLQGNVEYWSQDHLPYAIAAIVLFLLALIFPILLAYFSVMTILVSKKQKFQNCFVGRKKLQMPLDSFYKGFKVHLTFFAPLYLMYRVLFWIIAAFAYGKSGRAALSQILLILVLGVHCLVQPFQDASHNQIETVNLLNLNLINSLALFRVFWAEESGYVYHDALTVVDAIRIALTILPAVGLVLYVLKRLLWQRIKASLCRPKEPEEPDEDEPLLHREEMDTDE